MLIACAAVIAVVVASGCVKQSVPNGGNVTVAGCSDEARMEAARQFVLASSTYAFDGSNLQFAGSEQAQCIPQCWMYKFTFNSSRPGYGNRTGQDLPKYILEKPTRLLTAVVIVGCDENGTKVTQATLDDRWDMLADEAIETEAQIANPASTYCADTGGEVIIEDAPEGQTGYCLTADGDYCEEWAYFRSEGQDCAAPSD